MKKYKVKNIFGPTLQGEGSYSGSVVKFLRFAGCNRWTGLEKDRSKAVCSFCDTDFRGGISMDTAAIVTALNLLGTVRIVVISGGEPTLQVDETLLLALKEAGYRVHLETNGSNPLGTLHELFDHITMSPKQGLRQTHLEKAHDLKILYPPILDKITMEEFEHYPAQNRYLQAVWNENYQEHLKATLCRLYGNPKWRLSLQTHKIIGVD